MVAPRSRGTAPRIPSAEMSLSGPGGGKQSTATSATSATSSQLPRLSPSSSGGGKTDHDPRSRGGGLLLPLLG